MAHARRSPGLRLNASGPARTTTCPAQRPATNWFRSPPLPFNFLRCKESPMAKPIAFKPAAVDFKADLQRRLEKAPEEHAAALLAAYDVLEAAHDEGLLDILHGMIASKDTIISTLARFASQPEGVTGIRNLLTAAKILAELDPEILEHLSRTMAN